MPVYDLDSVRVAAREDKITYRGKGDNVMRDLENLEYTRADVRNCLLSLTESDFKKSHLREEGQAADDVYLIKYRKFLDDDRGERIDEIYIKFCMVNNRLVINLGSFHRSR